MTVQELYDWAVANGVEDCEITVNDNYGDLVTMNSPVIWGPYSDSKHEVVLVE